ncbi:uncharacterized protein STEHIDRAFT_159666 [Stereum hirsutum FP-91666 SS1]|uniref:uncharacterized protein n=1 Tax=Stereum hirsutum (strain FP-91666) TaxID=721885 RepID=UPI000444A192|nr:uncharacterized protein STEHIDRAFT_159666 [Stereum hirsutum FP-91666 SS1]EIM84064.1 hypothetical protein STEHIDRAFT_159666 [Stereum hirsutum FP-91666 SS1]
MTVSAFRTFLSPSHSSSKDDIGVTVIHRAAFFEQLRCDKVYASRFYWSEGCSYAIGARTFGELCRIATVDDANVHLVCIPQGPFFNRDQRPAPGVTASLEDTISKAEKSKRIPDFQVLLTEIMGEEHVDSLLACWAEIKPLGVPGSPTPERILRVMEAAIPQVNDQAAHAFKTIPKGEVFYAFIIVVTTFTLLRYTRPTPPTASASQSKSGSNNQPDTLVMPGPPEVVYWGEQMTDDKMSAFTREFRDALHQVLFPLGVELQPSWFQKEERAFALLTTESFHIQQQYGQTVVNYACVPVEERQHDEVTGEFVKVDETETPPTSKSDPTYAGNVGKSDWNHSPLKSRSRTTMLAKKDKVAKNTKEGEGSGQPKSK